MDVSHFSVYALAHVVPLVSKDVPHSLVYTEDSDALPVSPEIDLAIKEDHDWHLRYPNLRVRSMNVTVVEGYEPGKDLLSLPETDGFTTEWLEREGVLIISAIPGFDFTDNTLEDYGDSAVELVDVSEVLEKGEATAALKQFVPALRRVAFSSTTAGSQDRVMELSVMELLTAAVIAKISWTRVLNSPDPPEVHPTPVPATYFEKAPSTVVDPEVQVRHSRAPSLVCSALASACLQAPISGSWNMMVQRLLHLPLSKYLRSRSDSASFPSSPIVSVCPCLSVALPLPSECGVRLQVLHPDGRLIKAAKVWMEPMSASDILLYEPLAVNATVKAAVSVTVDLQTRGWIITGHAHEDAYSQIFQVPTLCWPWDFFLRSVTAVRLFPVMK